MKKLSFGLLFCFLACKQVLTAQTDTNTIVIINPSFEGTPEQGRTPEAWVDCGWRNETAPDIQPASNGTTPFFGVTKKPYDGNTYLGMVTRENDSYERIAQKLSQPMKKGRCYSFSLYMCRSLVYLSASNNDASKALKPYTTPIILRIYSGDAYCHQKELLAESGAVENSDWQKYEFKFSPNFDGDYFELEAFYKTPVLYPYNGNILLDKASNIVRLLCPNEKPFVNIDKKPVKNNKVISEKENSITPAKTDVKILAALDKNKIKVGQTIKIEKLYFQSDSSNIDSSSYAVLEEVFEFLLVNPKVKIEIGGHTNSTPSHEYCDKLSSSRAQSVKDYIINKGISSDRISSKGYGKRMPIAPNETKIGRAMNQRVEIKIISVG